MDELVELARAALAEHGHVYLTSAGWEDDVLVIRLEVAENGTESPPTTGWIVKCSGVREHRLALGWAEALAFTADHPLLWPHVRPWASLYFSASPKDPMEVVGNLWTRHRELVADWMPLERFVNRELPLAHLLDAGHGLLAFAPEPLVDEYAGVMERAKVPCSIVGRAPLGSWNDAQGWTVTSDQSSALRALALDDSYVVAEQFSASRE